MIDRDLHLARALLIEDNNLLRSVTAGQLRDLGIGHVATAARVQDARLMLEQQRFDIVLCNREFQGSDYSGQDLVDELRREHVLPHATVFLMVTAEAVTYHQVVEAGEAALDGFLVRPFTAAGLGTRIGEARKRKRELHEVLRALDAGDVQSALVRALKRFQEQQPYWAYCGRLSAELMLSLQRPLDALRIFSKLADMQPGASWAKLGQARALTAAGDLNQARQTVDTVLVKEPDSADAHELLARLLLAQCDHAGALGALRRAAELTPGCLMRLQHAGALAFYQGEAEEAQRWLDRALARGGVQSRLFDPLSLMLMALLRHDQGDSNGVAAMREQLRRCAERDPSSARLRRLLLAAAALTDLQGLTDPPPVVVKPMGRAADVVDDPLAALAGLSALMALMADGGEMASADFEFEVAQMLLAVWARMPASLQHTPEHLDRVRRLGMRFCGTRVSSQMLAVAALGAEPAASVLRDCQADVAALSQQALTDAQAGQPATAVQALLDAGERHGNARLLELAAQLAHRHKDALDATAQWQTRAMAALQRSGPSVPALAGLPRAGRSPGGLQLRGVQAAPASTAAHAAPASTAAHAAPVAGPSAAPAASAAARAVPAARATPATAAVHGASTASAAAMSSAAAVSSATAASSAAALIKPIAKAATNNAAPPSRVAAHAFPRA